MPENPYRPPASTAATATSDAIELARPATRLLAVMIDTLTVALFSFPFGYFVDNAVLFRANEVLLLVQIVAPPLFGVVVFTGINWTSLRNGQTIGKRAMAIRIVDLNGATSSVRKLLFLRYYPWWALLSVHTVGTGLFMAEVLLIFRKDRRCLHDLIAGTMVVTVSD